MSPRLASLEWNDVTDKHVFIGQSRPMFIHEVVRCVYFLTLACKVCKSPYTRMVQTHIWGHATKFCQGVLGPLKQRNPAK